MELFNFQNAAFLSKYSKEILYIGLAVAAVWLIVSLIVTFVKRNYSEGFVKFLRVLLRLALSVALPVALVLGIRIFSNYELETNRVYERYKEAYDNGEYMTVSGKVEEFTPCTGYKSFVVDGVKFTIYSSTTVQQHRDPEEKGAILYYTYTEESYQYQYNSISQKQDTVYSPEKCAILGDNQPLEIHYIEEYGQLRILYIKELTE